ncbi:hypothetical protein [Dongia rigui]|uniref:Uncharacterized protein n=1 Tax=Dongia rigui TaxID=940149 RepID=A0ABU5DTF5_9PROT|nr:hypothetical protein [Dongia rigui]MDY0870597.1 hypothetical protein [Dongia rigui]
MILAFASGAQRQMLFLGALAVIGLGLTLSGTRASLAADNEVECNSIKIQMQDGGFDTICGEETVSDVTIETLEANSTDGSHFLVVADLHTNYGYIFDTRGLRESLGDVFSELTFEHWRGGSGEQGLTTSEFDSEYKTVPSACVGFQKYTSRDQWGGWRRHIVGFGCSRTGNRDQVYKALKLIDFP